jgi:hypothetical protein
MDAKSDPYEALRGALLKYSGFFWGSNVLRALGSLKSIYPETMPAEAMTRLKTIKKYLEVSPSGTQIRIAIAEVEANLKRLVRLVCSRSAYCFSREYKRKRSYCWKRILQR